MIPDILQNGGRGPLNPKSQPQLIEQPGAKMKSPKIKSPATRAVPTCQHQSEEGKTCGSPTLRKLRYCYFHQPAHARMARMMAERVRQRWFESVAMDDPKAVQKALSEVIYRLVSGQIEHKKAGQLLYRLQTAIGSFRSAG
jgi:hypothetical protein